MKQTLLIIALFIGLGHLNAQSDATIEETINWINEHSLPNQKSTDPPIIIRTTNITILENDILFTRKINSDDEVWYKEYTIKGFTDIRVLPYGMGNFNIVLHWKGTKNGEFFDLHFTDKDLALRTLKAFKHLFELFGQDIKVVNNLVDENKF